MIAQLKSALNRCNIGYLLPKKQKQLLSIITFYLLSRISLAHNQIRAGFNNPWLKKDSHPKVGLQVKLKCFTWG